MKKRRFSHPLALRQLRQFMQDLVRAVPPEGFSTKEVLKAWSASSPEVPAGELSASAICNTTVQWPLGAGSPQGKSVPYNRQSRRAMRKHRKMDPRLSALRLGAVPSATRRRKAQASETQGLRKGSTEFCVPSPTFIPITSTTAFGPPTDISAGWDGALWAIDASGAPHLYDPTQNQWNPYGDGIDAVAAVGNTLYLFRSGESLGGQSPAGQVVQVDLTSDQAAQPAAIGAMWPKLPDSFKIGVTGAANLDGTLHLFKGGWYLSVSAPDQRAKLSALQGWPTTPNWMDGVIDAVVSNGSGVGMDGSVSAILTRGSEYIVVDFKNNKVLSGPTAIAEGTGWKDALPAGWLSGGWDGAVYLQHNGTTTIYVYRGPQVASFQAFATTVAQPRYIASIYSDWPATWNPVLNHAPSGRSGDLWAAAKDGGVLRYDGAAWSCTQHVGPCVSVGQDGSVYAIDTDGDLCLWDGSQFYPQGPDPQGAGFVQVAVGDKDHVWVRNSNNVATRYLGGGAFYPVDFGPGVPDPTHMSANADGTLWHCNDSNHSVFRLISEATNPSDTITVKDGSVTSVQKVASTGFGAAHCLVTENGQPQLYRYDSPYVFKTAQPYFTINDFAQGLGNLYLIKTDPPPIVVVALDAHTGREVARSQQGLWGDPKNVPQGLTFDPMNNLVYVSVAPAFANGDRNEDDSTPGRLLALDARTLAVKWSFETPSGIDAIPALNGTSLCFGDRSAKIYMIDTRDALAAAATGQPPTPKWTWTVPTTQAETYRVATPVLANGQVYMAVWALWDTWWSEDGHYPYFAQCNAEDGSNSGSRCGAWVPDNREDSAAPLLVVTAPVLTRLQSTVSGNAVEGPGLIVNTYCSVTGFFVDKELASHDLTYKVPGDARISTGFAYDGGARPLSQPAAAPSVWMGDENGNLYALGSDLLPVHGTPYQAGPGSGDNVPSISGTPVLYIDTNGSVNALFGLFGQHEGLTNLYIYSDGSLGSIPTGATQIIALTPITNGVMYVAGSQPNSTFTVTPQVFGINVDQNLFQSLRDFVIESQMMQDPDEQAPGGDSSDPSNPLPPSRARYQTHLTIVDDQKAPRPNAPVKIWADAPTTLLIDGQSFEVGPGDVQYAAVKTGVDGSLVIMSGYAKSDGSDTPDMYATPLRIWANFMDTYERIVVHPDHEFHGRVATAHANAQDDDPDKINLVTTRSYAGRSGGKPTPLFTSEEQNSGQPQNCANAISQMKQGVGLGGSSNSASTLYSRLMLHASGRKSARRILRAGNPGIAAASPTASTPKYVAYTDLTGSGYFPINIPARRPTVPVQPTGLIFRNQQGRPAKEAIFTVTDHATAQTAFDALPTATPNPPWLQDRPLGKSLGGNIFTDFWNWLKTVGAEITHIIVSIADEVMIGIRMIVNGAEQIFKAIIKVIDDIAAAIGSFFKMLFKVIEDVIAALSVLFHFGEIIHTHKWIRDQINANLDQVVDAMQKQVKPAVDQFFQQGGEAIESLFKSIRQQLGINDNTQINDVNSARSTAHTVFTAGPGKVGANSGGSSHAVQCTHTTQKMKNGIASATQPGQSIPSKTKGAPSIAAGDDPLSTFLTNFVDSLENDPIISAAFKELKSAVTKIGQSQSASDFFKSALNLLLTIIEDLILGMVAVSQALVDGLIGAIEALVTTVKGLLNTPLNIPFISWLYHWLFGEQLTILNAVSLVAAIPVTIVYRVVEGHYPSQDGITGAETKAALSEPWRATPSADVLKKMQGLVGGTLAGCLGVARGVVDLVGSAPGEDPPRIVQILVLALGVGYVSIYLPLVTIADPTRCQWATWGLGMSLALLGTFSIINLTNAGAKEFFRIAVPFLRAGLAAARFIVFVVDFAKAPKRNALTDVQFARDLFLGLPPGFNWLRILKEPEANMALAVIDVVTGVVVCALDITAGFLDTESAAGTSVSVQHG